MTRSFLLQIMCGSNSYETSLGYSRAAKPHVGPYIVVRIIDIWNSLPISLINCETIATFKKHLDCLLKNRGYNYISFLASFLLLIHSSFGVVS